MSTDTRDRTYNGWTNYETWAVGMFCDGNYDGEGLYLHVREMADEYRRGDDRDDNDVFGLADALKLFVEESVTSDSYEGLRGDLIGAALSEVDWEELAGHILSE